MLDGPLLMVLPAALLLGGILSLVAAGVVVVFWRRNTLPNRTEVQASADRQVKNLRKPESLDYDLLAGALWRRGKADEAAAAAQRAIELDGSNAGAHATLGVIYRQTGCLPKAVDAYRRAIELDPACSAAYIGLGVALSKMSCLDAAESAYRRALELEPGHAIAHSSLGVTLRKQGRDGEAEACYRRAIDLDPEYAPAWLNLGTVLQLQGRDEEAQVAYWHALELDVSCRAPRDQARVAGQVARPELGVAA